MGVKKKVDVVTVGAGMTAAILAQRLTEAGYHVVSLEMGPMQATNPDFQHNHDSLRYDVRHAMMVNLARETWSWRPNPKAPSLPMRQYGSFNPGQGVGGAGIHWSGMLWRFLQSDFKYRTHHMERYGKAKLPEGSTVQDWPLDYADLEPYYDRFEYDIGASGQAGNLNGTILPGGNPFEEPRRRPYPLPPLEMLIPSKMFGKAAAELGLHPFPQPAGILSQAYTDRFGNARSACLYCGFCTRYGCEADAKTMPVNVHIPPALKTGLYEIRPYSKVTQINVGKDGRATGVTYIDAQGQEQEQPADVVVLSAYTLTNVRLLLLSRSDQHPNGVGNDRNRVGKNYTYQHWHTITKGIFNGRRFNRYMGNTSTVMVSYDYNADLFDHSDLDFIGGASMVSSLGERDPVTSVGDMRVTVDGKKKGWGSDWKAHIGQNWNSEADILVQGESLPYEDQFLDLDPTYKADDGQPLLRLTFDWHPNDYNLFRFMSQQARRVLQQMGPDSMETTEELSPYNIYKYQSTHCTGGAIMGSDPGNSVTNKYGQVWDTPNVFVTGAALYPQNPGANPSETLSALAYMTGDALCDRYFKRPNELLV